jgi:hypothetical protein
MSRLKMRKGEDEKVRRLNKIRKSECGREQGQGVRLRAHGTVTGLGKTVDGGKCKNAKVRDR